MVSYPDPNVRYDDHRLRTFGSGYETKGGGGGKGGDNFTYANKLFCIDIGCPSE